MFTEHPDAVTTGLLLAVPFIIVVVKRAHEKRVARCRDVSDEEQLMHIARLRRCSELDLFREAADAWRVPDQMAEGDFKSYLQNGDLPHYVRDYVRRNRLDRDQLERLIYSVGGILTASWMMPKQRSKKD